MPEVEPGLLMNCTVHFNNTGFNVSSTVWINVSIPFGLSYVWDSSGLEGGMRTGFSNWTFGNVTVGSHSFFILMSVSDDVQDGETMTIFGGLDYVDELNKPMPPSGTFVTVTARRPMISLTITADTYEVAPGQVLNYTLAFQNIGSRRATSVFVNDSLPWPVRYVNDSAWTIGGIIVSLLNWSFSDVTGLLVFNLTVEVQTNLSGGMVFSNNVRLYYQNAHGIWFPMVVAGNSSITVSMQQPFLELILQDRTVTSTPFDEFALDIKMRSESPKPSLQTWLNVTLPPEMQYVSDNASDIGGVRTGSYRWEFDNIDYGNHSFTVVTQISSPTSDGAELMLDIELDHTDEVGNSFPTITDRIIITIQAPDCAVGISSDKDSYQRSETSAVTISLSNTGSVPAERVWVTLSVPRSIKHVNDTSASIGGSMIGPLSYEFVDLEVGVQTFIVYFDLDDVNRELSAEIWVFLNYTDSNGDLIGESSQSASFSVIVPAEEFPLFLLIALVAVLALGISFAAAASRESTKYSILLFILPLFSRLRREQVLDHETRGMIRGYIIANPGDHFNSIKATLGLKNGTLAHHINILERESLIKSVKDGKYRRFFPIGMKVTQEAYPTKIEMMILEVIEETPGITQKDIAKQLGMSQPTASYHLSKLKDANRIRTKKHGISVRHYLNESEE